MRKNGILSSRISNSRCANKSNIRYLIKKIQTRLLAKTLILTNDKLCYVIRILDLNRLLLLVLLSVCLLSSFSCRCCILLLCRLSQIVDETLCSTILEELINSMSEPSALVQTTKRLGVLRPVRNKSSLIDRPLLGYAQKSYNVGCTGLNRLGTTRNLLYIYARSLIIRHFPPFLLKYRFT